VELHRPTLGVYKNCLKIAAGLACWKEDLEEVRRVDDGTLEPFATTAMEAVALLCLENNQQDWLQEAKILQ
jgi:hypothetical protein